MKLRTRMMMCVLVALPALAFAGDGVEKTVTPAKPAFDLKTSKVQGVIRSHAVAQTAVADPEPAESAPSDIKPLPFRAPRRVHHVDCDSFHCVAYTADDDVLFSIPREQYFGVSGNGHSSDSWLACQSGNDLLSTFERYDKCRGVSIGLPAGRDLMLSVPLFNP
jgi:hypothetical protein